MTKQVLKSIAAGLLLGAAVFFIPFFLLRVAAAFLLISVLFRLFVGHKLRSGFGRRFQPGFMDKIRTMSDEEYTQLKQKMESRCHTRNRYAEAPVH